mgnify:CR=1 FL=1
MAAPTDTPEQLANAELTRVLAKFMLDLQTTEHGYRLDQSVSFIAAH